MKNIIQEKIRQSAQTKIELLKKAEEIETVTKKIIECYKKGNKLVIFGNGGSASDAQHMAAELMGWLENKNRPPLEAIAINTDTSIMTAVANDKGYHQIFARQIRGHVKKGDIAIGISTSGNSTNVNEALKEAKKLGATTIGLTSIKGTKMEPACHHCIKVPATNTERIQEAHITILHIICKLVEQEAFK